jgi:LysR family transcriptional regulator, regulator for genes of the gallate degradation pathway
MEPRRVVSTGKEALLLLNPRHLRAFSAVAETGSITKSGQALRRAQSAVTRAIQELERALGAELFERHTHGMTLTDIGRALQLRVERAQAEMSAASAAFANDLAGGRPVHHAPIFSFSIGRQRLLTYVKLAEQHSVSVVSESLGVSQPAVSQTLREIEDSVGVKLFRRTARGVMPTPLGAVLALHIGRSLNELRIAEDEISFLKGAGRGRVAVGSLSVGRAQLLPRAVTILLARFPNLSVTTEEGTFEHLSARLRAGEIDFILGALRPLEQTVGFTRKIVTHDTMSVVVRSGHSLSRRTRVSVKDIRSVGWVLPPHGAPTRELVEASFAQRHLGRPQVKVETADLAVTFGIVMQSDMVTAVSEHQFHLDLVAAGLQVLPIELSKTRRPIGILQREGGIPSQAARHLIDILLTVGAADRASNKSAMYKPGNTRG